MVLLVIYVHVQVLVDVNRREQTNLVGADLDEVKGERAVGGAVFEFRLVVVGRLAAAAVHVVLEAVEQQPRLGLGDRRGRRVAVGVACHAAAQHHQRGVRDRLDIGHDRGAQVQ